MRSTPCTRTQQQCCVTHDAKHDAKQSALPPYLFTNPVTLTLPLPDSVTSSERVGCHARSAMFSLRGPEERAQHVVRTAAAAAAGGSDAVSALISVRAVPAHTLLCMPYAYPSARQ
jgi:hypothetical protein